MYSFLLREREFEEKQQRDKRESRDVMGAWTNSRDYDQRVGRVSVPTLCPYS